MKRILFIFVLFIFALNIANAQNPAGFSISGNTVPCRLGEETYSVNLPNPIGVCTYESFNWSVDRGGQVISQSSSSCVIQWDADHTEATITVKVNHPPNSCAAKTVKLNVQVGIGSNVSASFPSPVVAGSDISVTFSATQKRDVTYYYDYAVAPQNDWQRAGGAEPRYYESSNVSSVKPGFNGQMVSV